MQILFTNLRNNSFIRISRLYPTYILIDGFYAPFINNGSGKLNPSDGEFLNEFRKGEAVDISYTKFRDPPIDNNAYNIVDPIMDQLYVGWTVPGEWINYTVEVNITGTYNVGIMYTASGDGGISLDIDG
jgi:hypothetical protein